ncbi:hypothetical protein F1C58_00360 [Glaciihabitans sp. INWT7]|uniref:hypothetical protein n=1 Tax=Glaciihabitans sp. INWT7 TaxID=2596912 RepID=UPI0016243820|nr:hypothetical protein [Glaciihabitans sp. INWT7]QNE45533.1 hypothetical protein F1C58_00360 [Glaciihabitans sp. INWT7]
MVAKRPWWDRLNRRLLPYIGPPPLGPYNEEPLPPTQAKACPVCGNPMVDHDVERRADRPTQLHCPA